jgi:uncharacterized RmlC-like cupin family protein
MCIHCRGKVFIDPLPGNIYRYTDWWEEFMKYTVEMGSGAMIYIPNFINIGSDIQKLI